MKIYIYINSIPELINYYYDVEKAPHESSTNSSSIRVHATTIIQTGLPIQRHTAVWVQGWDEETLRYCGEIVVHGQGRISAWIVVQCLRCPREVEVHERTTIIAGRRWGLGHHDPSRRGQEDHHDTGISILFTFRTPASAWREMTWSTIWARLRGPDRANSCRITRTTRRLPTRSSDNLEWASIRASLWAIRLKWPVDKERVRPICGPRMVRVRSRLGKSRMPLSWEAPRLSSTWSLIVHNSPNAARLRRQCSATRTSFHSPSRSTNRSSTWFRLSGRVRRRMSRRRTTASSSSTSPIPRWTTDTSCTTRLMHPSVSRLCCTFPVRTRRGNDNI